MRKLIGKAYYMCFHQYMPIVGFMKQDYILGRINHQHFQDLANGNARWIWTKI